jgi:opacity protein-like surface antigen
MNPRPSFIVAAALTALSLPAMAAAAVADKCGSPSRAASSSLRVDNGNIQYDFTKTRDDLFNLYRENRKDSAAGHLRGLTMSRLQYNVETKVRILPVSGGFCVELSSVQATLGYPQLKVYVDQRYVIGGCNHEAVLKHELEHAAINRRVLAKYGKDLAAAQGQRERAPFFRDQQGSGA